MKDLIEKVQTLKLRSSGEKIHQTDRNNLRADIQKAQAELYKNYQMYQTKEGICVVFENEELGAIPVIFSATIKDLNFDFEQEEKDYLAEIEEKKAKAEQKAKETQEKKAKADLAKKEKKA